MALAVPSANNRKRVKVYELKQTDWYDRGTGFCSGAYVDVSCICSALLIRVEQSRSDTECIR